MTIDSSSARRPAGLRSGLSLWLLGSICLNVAFASYFVVQTLIASPQLTIPYAENEGAAMLDGRIGRFAARLPDKDAEILWEVYRVRKPQMAVAMAAAEDARAGNFDSRTARPRRKRLTCGLQRSHGKSHWDERHPC
jgi:hypothetical protein